MRQEDLRAFARRDWVRVERAKLAFWAQKYAKHGPAPAIRTAEMLRLHVLAHSRTSLPTQRREDLAHHIHLKRRIDAASAWFLARAHADDGVLAKLGEARRRPGRTR